VLCDPKPVFAGRESNIAESHNMKLLALTPLLLSLASSTAIPDPPRVSYDGYKVFRVNTRHALEDVQNKLSSFSFDTWNDDVAKHMDIALSPDQIAAFEALELDYHCMHENLGASIAAESAGQPAKWKRQVDDMAWFDTYHPYGDHKQYFEDLQAKFPSNSEMISSGTSYQGRDLFGIHLWGRRGKDANPAILWHGSVHAREWITTMVRICNTLWLPKS
jgi:Zinc carboxypeptidase